MTIEFARNVLGLTGANSTEIDPTTPHPVIDLMHDQRDVVDKGGTKRLGAYYAILEPDTRSVAAAYGEPVVSERHRHRYEFNAQLQAEARGRRAALQRARRPTGGWSSSSSSRITRSGSARRPTPSSRAAPTARIRCSASWSTPRWPAANRARRTCSSSTKPARPSRDRRWRCDAARRPGFVTSAIGSCTRDTSGTSSSPRSRRPTASVRARHRPLARRGRRRAAVVRRRGQRRRWCSCASTAAPFDRWCSRSRRACATSPTSRSETTAERELIEEVGLRPAGSSYLTDFYPSAGMTDSVLHVYLATDLDAGRARPARSGGDAHGGAPPAARRGGRRWSCAARSTTPRPSSACCWSSGGCREGSRLVDLVDRDVGLGDDAAARGRGVPVVDGHRAGPVGQHAVGVPARPDGLLRRGWPSTDATLRRVDRPTLDALRRRAPRRGRRRVVVARQLAAIRMLHRFLAEEGVRARRPDRRPRRHPGAGRHPQAAHRGRGRRAARRAGGNEPVGLPRPGAARAAVRDRRADLRGLRAVARRHRPRRSSWCACSARARRSGSSRSVGTPRRRSTEWLGPSGRPHLEPRRWARRGDAEAVFLNQRGARLSRQAAWAVVKKYGDRVGLGAAPVAARAAALVRDPPARPRRRPAHRAGDARPRLDLDDAGVHQGQPGAAVARCTDRPTRGPSADEPRSPRRSSRSPVRHLAVAAEPDRRRRGVGRRRSCSTARSRCGVGCRPPIAGTPSRSPDASSRADRLDRATRWPARCCTTSARSTPASARSAGCVATVVGPRTQRFRRYHDHEAIGADVGCAAGFDARHGRPGPRRTGPRRADLERADDALSASSVRVLTRPGGDCGQRGEEADARRSARCERWRRRPTLALSAPLRSSAASSPRSSISSR